LSNRNTLMRSQLHHLVADAATRWPDAPAISYKRETLSYSALWSSARAVGAGLLREGLLRGDRVAIYLEKRPENVSSIFGVSLASGVFVPINPILRQKQVSYILDNCSCRALITTPERLDLLRDELASCSSLELIVVTGSVTADPSVGAKVIAWDDLAREAPDSDSRDGGVVDGDIAAILYTSGSTGKPKGVVVSHRNLLVGAESVSSYLENRPSDVILAVLPLSFDAGFSQLTTAFNAGAHVVLVNYLMPEEVVRLCARHQVTGITAVPPLWMQLVEKPWPEEAARSVRYFANTGGRMPKATLDALRAVFPLARAYLMYGLTEAFRSSYLDPKEVDRRPDSIGKAIPNAELLVVRPDGSLCEPGENGELVHRGPLVTLGYWKDPQRTAERFKPAPGRPDGLCMTEMAVWSGDLVVRDNEGFLYFVGRNDEMIKTSGYRVSPSEIEEIAFDTGIIRDAVALGFPDDKLGQHIVLIVSPAEGRQFQPEELIVEFKKRAPLYMVPQRIVVRAELPRSPNGKFDRNVLKNELLDQS
jgi:acyl-CoA ligase (AMP-forming) (exosortase A-associated)